MKYWILKQIAFATLIVVVMSALGYLSELTLLYFLGLPKPKVVMGQIILAIASLIVVVFLAFIAVLVIALIAVIILRLIGILPITANTLKTGSPCDLNIDRLLQEPVTRRHFKWLCRRLEREPKKESGG